VILMLPIILISLLFGGLPSNQEMLTVAQEETFSQLTDSGLTASVTLKTILPDGSHALLRCFVDGHTSCAEVQNLPPEKLPAKNVACHDSTDHVKELGYVHMCSYENLGQFRFVRKGDEVTVYHRAGKTKFKVTDSW
jgi:hypothetical protein